MERGCDEEKKASREPAPIQGTAVVLTKDLAVGMQKEAKGCSSVINKRQKSRDWTLHPASQVTRLQLTQQANSHIATASATRLSQHQEVR